MSIALMDLFPEAVFLQWYVKFFISFLSEVSTTYKHLTYSQKIQESMAVTIYGTGALETK